MSDTEVDYTKYLEADPTPLMEHIEAWIRDKTGFDPSKDARTKDDAFAMGVILTVALRTHHQASPENQERLGKARDAAEAREAEAEERRQARASRRAAKAEAAEEEESAPKRRGRTAKAAPVAETQPATPKRRGRPPKAKSTEAPVVEKAAPKRRGRPPKAAAPAEEVPSNVTALPARAEGEAAPRRRRPVRRGAEAAF